MSSLSMLIKNENTKIYRRPRTFAMIGLMLIALMLVAGIMKYDSIRFGDNPNWKEQLQETNLSMQTTLDESKDGMDPGSVNYLKGAIKKNEYHLEHNINPDAFTVWAYMDTSSALIILITILTVIVAADMIAAEFTWGTVKLLLVGPASRAKVLAAKYIATFIFALVLLFVCLIVSFGLGAALEGIGSLSQSKIAITDSGDIIQTSYVLDILKKYAFSVVSLVMYVTFAFMISAAFRSSSMAIGFSLLFILMGNTLVAVLQKYEWVKYLLFANVDLAQYFDGRSPLRPEMTLNFSILMLALYYVVFQIAAWLLFTRRDVAG